METAAVIIPGDYMLMCSCLFVLGGKIALWLLGRHQSSSERCRRRRRLANVLIDSRASSKDLHFYYKAREREEEEEGPA